MDVYRRNRGKRSGFMLKAIKRQIGRLLRPINVFELYLKSNRKALMYCGNRIISYSNFSNIKMLDREV